MLLQILAESADDYLSIDSKGDLGCSSFADSLRDLDWDLAGMLLLAKFCLRHDAARTPLGESMLRALVRAQRADGAIATSAGASSAQAAYHPTLVAALASCVLSSAGPRAAAKPR